MIDLVTERRDREFFDCATDLARLSDYHFRVGCVAAHNNKKLAGAFNTIRNHPGIAPFGFATVHAECNCLRLVPDRLLSRITLYVARINKDGELKPSKPCHRCIGELATAGVREVVYFNGKIIIKRRFP